MDDLVWFGMVRFGFEWYGIWVISRCTNMQNFELWSFQCHGFGKIAARGAGGGGFMITKALQVW